MDFDGDGIADTLIGGVVAPGSPDLETTGSHTAVVRSGRDGHVLWKSIVDPIGTWFSPTSGNAYSLLASPAPRRGFQWRRRHDVIVVKNSGGSGGVAPRRAATLPSSFFGPDRSPPVVGGRVARRTACAGPTRTSIGPNRSWWRHAIDRT